MATDASATLHRPLCPDARHYPTVAGAAHCAEQARPFVLAATILASAMAFIDGSVVHIALPALQEDLGASFAAVQWVANAYMLLLGGLILVGGAAGDRFGRKRVFVIGIAVFAVTSLVCAVAPNAEALIAARAAQGFGAALLVPQSLAIISAAFPKEVRGRAIGVWAGAAALTTAMGPPLGGFLIDAVDWRAVFWINLPVSAVALWLAARFVPESRNPDVQGGLDWLGSASAVAGFGCLTIGLTMLSDGAERSALGLGLMSAGVAGLAVFVWVETRAANPLMPLSLFRSAQFNAANLITVFLYGAMSAALFLLPFDLIARRDLSASEVGLALLPFGVIIGLLSQPVGAWADRWGPRVFLAAGSLLTALAAAMLAQNHPSYWLGAVIPVVVMAAGMALVVAPLTTAVMNAADDAHAGAASGVNNAASRLAGLFAVAIVGAVASIVFAGAGEGRFGVLPERGDPARAGAEAAFASAYAAAQWTAAAWGALAAALALVFFRKPSR